MKKRGRKELFAGEKTEVITITLPKSLIPKYARSKKIAAALKSAKKGKKVSL